MEPMGNGSFEGLGLIWVVGSIKSALKRFGVWGFKGAAWQIGNQKT